MSMTACILECHVTLLFFITRAPSHIARTRAARACQRRGARTLYVFSFVCRARARDRGAKDGETHARRAKGNPVPIPEPGSGTAYNSGPRKSVRRGNPK